MFKDIHPGLISWTVGKVVAAIDDLFYDTAHFLIIMICDNAAEIVALKERMFVYYIYRHDMTVTALRFILQASSYGSTAIGLSLP